MAQKSVDFDFSALRGLRVLVLGLGGGADIISAYAVARLLESKGCRSVVYANTKKRKEEDWVPLSAHISHLPLEPFPAKLSAAHGTSAIDRCLPRGYLSCPWIFDLEGERDEALSEELKAFDFDALVGVDTGGDVLRRGKRGRLGRDQRMWKVLRGVGLPAWLFIVGPGSDGEMSRENLEEVMGRLPGYDCFQGWLDMKPLLEVFEAFHELWRLPRTRTPSIILEASRSEDLELLVARCHHPIVKRDWLNSAFVLHAEAWKGERSVGRELDFF